MKTNRLKLITKLLAGLAAGLLFVLGVFKPAYNWDMVGYVSAALVSQYPDPTTLHRATYTDIKNSVPAEAYHHITMANEYRQVVASKPESLSQHLPFYTIRMAYVEAMKGLSAIFGISLSKTTYVLSAIMAGFSGALIFIFIENLSVKALMFVLPSIPFSGLVAAAPLSTPDTMATFGALAILFLFIKNHRALYFALALIPWIRTDYIILPVLIAGCFFLRKDYRSSLLALVPAVISYWLVNKMNANYGYVKIFNFTLIETNPFPAKTVIASSLSAYLEAYTTGLKQLIGHRHFILYLGVLAYWNYKIRPLKVRKENELLLLTLGFVALHMLLFPAYFERFFIWPILVLSTCLPRWIWDLKKESKSI